MTRSRSVRRNLPKESLAHEAIRVVALHHPQFQRAATANVTYRGGALIDQLSEYNVAGKAIGHGSFIGATVVTADAPVSSVTDSAIQKALKNWIASGTIPENDKDTVRIWRR